MALSPMLLHHSWCIWEESSALKNSMQLKWCYYSPLRGNKKSEQVDY